MHIIKPNQVTHLCRQRLTRLAFGLALLGMWPLRLLADTWATPQDTSYQSENNQFQFWVTVGRIVNGAATSAQGTLSRRAGEHWQGVWTNRLVNRISPVRALVADSGRFVVTLDDYHAVGQHPVVIYGSDGRVVADLTLADLRLEHHPQISRSVSSYWWNESAVILFGPKAKLGGPAWERTLEDSMFIRLYWGEVIQIDLASGKLRDAAWWQALPPATAGALRDAAEAFLDATWRRLAREYFRKANFDPDPKAEGVIGLLLVGQLRLRDELPLVREIAAIERFRHWAAPRWKGNGTVHELARAVMAELE